MSLVTEAVKIASREREQSVSKPPQNEQGAPVLLWVALALCLVMTVAAVLIYRYEESKILLLNNEIKEMETGFQNLRNQNSILTEEKTELEAQLEAQSVSHKEKLDEILGRDKVLQYQVETLQSDNIQKDKKIEELEAQIQKQIEKEASLMTLIEEAKKQLTSQSSQSAPLPATAAPAAETEPKVAA